MPVVQKNYFTSREAAEHSGVTVSTIPRWTNNGLLRAWTTGGGHRRIARNSGKEILADQREATVDRSQQQLSVVIVEDNTKQLRLYEKQFCIWDMKAQVVTAKDGYEGLIKIGRILPDVIITDLMMPNLDGLQMVRALTELPELKESLIVVVSGLTKDEIAVKGGLPQGVHLFRKPFPFADVERLMRQKMQHKAA